MVPSRCHGHVLTCHDGGGGGGTCEVVYVLSPFVIVRGMVGATVVVVDIEVAVACDIGLLLSLTRFDAS